MQVARCWIGPKWYVWSHGMGCPDARADRCRSPPRCHPCPAQNDFLASAGTESDALLERLAVLHRVCELYVFARQAVLGIPLEWLRALLRAALDAFKSQVGRRPWMHRQRHGDRR